MRAMEPFLLCWKIRNVLLGIDIVVMVHPLPASHIPEQNRSELYVTEEHNAARQLWRIFRPGKTRLTTAK